jgi:RNA polymerase sigma factor (sigma-70 family)
MDGPPSEIERQIGAFLARGELEQVAIASLRAYADELLGYLIGLLRNEEHAREVFSMFAEDLWHALPKLTLRTTMRAYCYALARHAARRYLARDVRKQRRAVPLSAAELLSKIIAQPRTATPAHADSENQRRVAALRARLTAEEQELLTLRIDRGLEWTEVVEALGEGLEPGARREARGDDTARAVARYRKRFQLIKQKLARWVREEGLAPPSGD